MNLFTKKTGSRRENVVRHFKNPKPVKESKGKGFRTKEKTTIAIQPLLSHTPSLACVKLRHCTRTRAGLQERKERTPPPGAPFFFRSKNNDFYP